MKKIPMKPFTLLTAEAKLDQGEIRKALDLYENFSKRRSNAVLVRKGKKIQIGPEALFRAAILRETRGIGEKPSSTSD